MTTIPAVTITRYGRHADPSRYDEYRDLERAYNESRADDHEPWCHWNCRGHYACSACPVADGWYEFWEHYASEHTLPQRWVLGTAPADYVLRGFLGIDPADYVLRGYRGGLPL